MSLNAVATTTDLSMNRYGDLDLKNGDFVLVNGENLVAQMVLKVLMTSNPDWRFHPVFGADIEDYIGEINNERTGIEIKRQILYHLNNLDVAYVGNFDVRVIPTSESEIQIIVFFDIGSGKIPVVTDVKFDFRGGVAVELPTEDSVYEGEIGNRVTQRRNKYIKRIRS